MAGNEVRFRMGGGQVHVLTLDASKLMGDALLELERELAPESAFAWLDRMTRILGNGWRSRDVRIRDIIGIVYLSRAQADPGITWSDVAKETAPFAVQVLDDDEPDEPAPAETAAPAAAPADPPRSVSPVVAKLAEQRVAEIGMPAVVVPSAQ